MHGSDEEIDDPPEIDSDEDLSDDGSKHFHEEVCMKFDVTFLAVLFVLTSHLLSWLVAQEKLLWINSLCNSQYNNKVLVY